MLGYNIKKLRKKNNLSINELAQKANISTSYLYQLERGDRRYPSVETLNKIAESLKVTVNDLLEFDVELENGGTASYSFKNKIPNIDKVKPKQLSKNELNKRRIEYIKNLHAKNPNDEKISKIIKKLKSSVVLSDEDIEIIDSYKEAELFDNFLGGGLAIISGAENDAFVLFEKLLIALGYSNDEISGYNAYLFKKIKAQIELEIKLLRDKPND